MKKSYPGGFRLTLKTARALAVQEFGTAKRLEPDRATALEMIPFLNGLYVEILPRLWKASH